MKEMWLKWKEWWSQLALREKQAVMLGGPLLIIFILYQWIWSPYLDYVNGMRKRIGTEQKLLLWMQEADAAINKIAGQSKTKIKAVSPVMLLSVMKKQVNKAGLEQYLTQLKQATNESIELHFQKIEFDKLIKVIISVMKEQPVSILQMSVVADNTPGIVNADIILKSV